MRLPRFTILQLLLAAALVALVLGLFTSSWRVSTYDQIAQIAFSPSGNLLAARYSGGAVQVWRLDQGAPRLVAQAFGRAPLLGYDASTMHFVSDDKLLKLEQDYSVVGGGTIVRELTISKREERELGRIAGLHFMYPLVVAAPDRIVAADWQSGQVVQVSLATLKRGPPLPLTAAELRLSSDGRTLAIMEQDRKIHIFDAAGQEVAQLAAAARRWDAFALSADGSTLAVPHYGPSSTWPTAVVSLYAAHAPTTPRDIQTGLAQVQWVDLSADGRRLVVCNREAAECYDAQSGGSLVRIVLEEPPPTALSLVIPQIGLFQLRMLDLAPSGQWLASVNGSQIFLRELPGGRLAHVITGGSRWLQIAIFTLGFAGWAAAWGIVARRERERRRREGGSSREPASVILGRAVPVVRSPWQTIAGPLVWLGIVVGLLLILFAWGQPLSLSSLLATFGSLLGTLAAVLALAIGYIVLARLFLGRHYFTLIRLRQVTASQGRTFPCGEAQFWFAAASPYEADVWAEYSQVRIRAQELFGSDATPTRSARAPAVLVAWLDRQCDLDALVGRHTPVSAVVPDVRRGSWGLVCEETARRSFLRPLAALRATVGLMHWIRAKRGLPPGWTGGLVLRELCRDEESPAAVRAAIRRLQVLLARQPDWQPLAVLTRSVAERRDLWLNAEQPHAWKEVCAENDLLATLHALLLGPQAHTERREKTLTWLRGIQLRDDPLVSFQAAVGTSLEALLTEWRSFIDRGEAAYDVPPIERQGELRASIARFVQDRSRPLVERERAVRSLGGTSYVGVAGCLIELLADPRCEFRAEVVRSLENLSGRPLGDDPGAWRAWWNALSPELRWQAESLSPAAERSSGPLSEPRPAERRMQTGAGSPPLELKLLWGLMAVGGLVALAIPITFLFLVGPVVFLTIYFSLFVGVQALVRAAGRQTEGLSGAINLQAINIVACDPINLLLAGLEKALLRRTAAQQYLQQAGPIP